MVLNSARKVARLIFMTASGIMTLLLSKHLPNLSLHSLPPTIRRIFSRIGSVVAFRDHLQTSTQTITHTSKTTTKLTGH